ncbi:MAG: PAS domain S-box protein [Pseudomonadota bacterium]
MSLLSKIFGLHSPEQTAIAEEKKQAELLALQNMKGQIAAIHKAQAVIEFSLEGNILHANENFLHVMGYSLSEIIGQHHSLFVDPDTKKSADYQLFWSKLGRGEYDSGVYKRIGKGGTVVWIQASYSPIFDGSGKPFKVVKYATDITEQKVKNADYESQLKAISKSQAVIEFDLNGNILLANDNFLKVLGYTQEEVKGQHHSVFVEPAYRQSMEYRLFWEKLRQGEYNAGQFKRLTKSGSEVWIQASYNPIYDAEGKIKKVVKYATDITEQINKNSNYEGQLNAIHKSQAVIEFDMSGKVLMANDNFLNVLGYSLDEIKGQHHSLFVEAAYRQSVDYRQFWEKLGRGEYMASQYKRIGKGGREVWIQASYNPILDLNGKPFKVVKYATDVTAQHLERMQLEEVIKDIDSVVTSAKNHDLRQRVSLENKTGSFASLCAGVNDLIDGFVEVISVVREASDSINTSAQEIATGNTDLSRRTEEQAASVEKTAATMEELTTTVQENAKNALLANQLATTTADIATKGGKAVEEVVGTMRMITESSREISEIISVIDSIAFQTNILALNAAVEAARAGEQGRGFAVVASEVRSLAQRSANAAKEIKGLISDSTGKVETGSRLVSAAGKTMQEIVQSVESVTGMIAQISVASQQQTSGIELVNKAITEIEKTTQQNAALVEEAAAAAESMGEQTLSLNRSVGIYKLNNSHDRMVSQSAISSKPKAKALPSKSKSNKSLNPTPQEDEWESF